MDVPIDGFLYEFVVRTYSNSWAILTLTFEGAAPTDWTFWYETVKKFEAHYLLTKLMKNYSNPSNSKMTNGVSM
jgi:hypothetical protein